MLDRKVKLHENVKNEKNFDSFGSLEYINIVDCSKFVIGNSSSAIFETLFLSTPAIEIVTRQQGRINCNSVIQIDPVQNQIKQAMGYVLRNKNNLIIPIIHITKAGLWKK
jgi:GDP/UDP-N,N'-diacetylbacillosamine 2-epimerase (hydrolysing)